MRRCIDLASCAEGMTFPNPLVGSVIVHNGLIIGEGYHLRAGLAHAEVNAINSVVDRAKLRESTLYVNLEPCSHFGKTPPCADLIISSGIPKVVIGAKDTSRKINGEGIKRLRAAGVEVITGVCENESRWVNRRFFSFVERSRPWIILKWAQSADCFLDVIRKEDYNHRPTWISGKSERILVHRWRSFEQSILAGAGTIRADEPQLNVREWAGSSPLRIVLSSTGNLPEPPVKAKQIVFTHNVKTKIKSGTDFIVLDKNRESCIQIAEYLYKAGIQSLFIEGGASVLNHFIANNLWDEARIFTGFEKFNNGIEAPLLHGEITGSQYFSKSKLQMCLNEAVKGFVI
ncbi:MAG TPA: bifunctional diaminohydroxyphosphoribosylaminopyrimidine deaminase/5-amino-6-(5-phosphoribosylamino)uracil reductase RibD [Bacteroidales bacterium]|nr:bifunctional diaminohydroxyphosphoribosylaminopyrimidine deaminase/5-amino-6-(5-phosphoribosylamino)uracil reductase RibD [Bacteroidales bacterium]